jgi:hypothetical protein
VCVFVCVCVCVCVCVRACVCVCGPARARVQAAQRHVPPWGASAWRRPAARPGALCAAARRTQNGQRYEPHHDYFSFPSRDDRGGNRMLTVLVRWLRAATCRIAATRWGQCSRAASPLVAEPCPAATTQCCPPMTALCGALRAACPVPVQMYLVDVEEGGETVFPHVPKLPSQTRENGWSDCAMQVRGGAAHQPAPCPGAHEHTRSGVTRVLLRPLCACRASPSSRARAMPRSFTAYGQVGAAAVALWHARASVCGLRRCNAAGSARAPELLCAALRCAAPQTARSTSRAATAAARSSRARSSARQSGSTWATSRRARRRRRRSCVSSTGPRRRPSQPGARTSACLGPGAGGVLRRVAPVRHAHSRHPRHPRHPRRARRARHGRSVAAVATCSHHQAQRVRDVGRVGRV